MNLLKLTLFGKFHATFGQEPLPLFRTSKVQALLVYLAVEHAAGQAFPNNTSISHRRETLMDLLWSDMPLKSAQANLRQTLYLLRKMIPDQHAAGGAAVHFLESSKLSVGINPAYQFQLDVAQFVENLHQRRLERAVALYRGDFLEDFYLPDSAEFESWVQVRRTTYRHQILEALQSLAGGYLQSGQYDQAYSCAMRQIELDNLRESAYRQAMEALARSGKRQEALSQYETLCERLYQELAVDPDAETIALVKAIRSGDLAGDASTDAYRLPRFGFERELPRHNLPQRLTSFVGREHELQEVTELISNNRLVMLAGVGGIGKTKLTLEVGCALVDEFPNGVWLVELAPIVDPQLVPKTAASAMGLRDLSSQPILQTLLEFLQERNCLLILDNCEHLIDASAQFAETVLEACPGVKILASSREAMHIGGEILYVLPPLSFPDVHQLPSHAEWEQYGALCLFVDQATAVLPTFQVTQENFSSIVQICRQLDGIPLALELAAARVNVLPAGQIAARLDDRFLLLTGGSRTAMPRHQTLRGMIDWSWDLLDAGEQRLLPRLSVFAGGMTLEAVEAVCAGDGIDAADILDLLSGLVKKSLVTARRAQGQETRYGLLETIRQYAKDRLEASGREEEFRHRHLDYFSNLGELAVQALVGPDQVAWLKMLAGELDNIRSALTWACIVDVESGLVLATNLWQFWEHAFIREGETWLKSLQIHSESVDPALRAKALSMRGRFNSYLNNFDLARRFFENSQLLYREIGEQQEFALGFLPTGFSFLDDLAAFQEILLKSLRLFQASGDKVGAALVLLNLGYFEKNYEKAKVYFLESESLVRQLGHLAGIAEVLGFTGWVAIWNGDFDFAREKLEESLELEDLLGSVARTSLVQLGVLHWRLGDFQQAQKYLEKALALCHQTGNKWAGDWAHVFLGYVFLRSGKLAKAHEILVKSQQRFREHSVISGVVFAIEGLASLAVSLGQFRRAARLFAWADATRAALPDPRPPIEQADVDRNVEAIIEMIGEEAYAAAYAEGKTMTVDQAIAEAMELKVELVGALNGDKTKP